MVVDNVAVTTPLTATVMTASSSSLVFQKEDLVLCYHGPMLYDAKIRDIRYENGITEYYIHYQGWPAKWDEWVRDERMMEVNEASRELQNKLKVENKVGGVKKRKKEHEKVVIQDVESKEEYVEKKEVYIGMPTVLKLALVEDYDQMMRQSKLVPLPRDPSVKTLLERYRQERIRAGLDSRKSHELDEFVKGLELYFKQALGVLLLYRVEREQYANLYKEKEAEVDVTQVYGAEHLLRLFVKLPGLLVWTDLSEDELNVLRAWLMDFMQWWVSVKDDVFLKEYVDRSIALM